MKRNALLFPILLTLLMLLSAAVAEELNYRSDFTLDTDGWYGRGASIRITADGLYTEGRSATWNSPGRAFSLAAGANYDIQVEVLQTELDSGRFILSVEHARDGVTSYENLVSADVPRGEWTTLAVSWTAGSYDTYVLYVEGGAADTSFVIRDFRLAGAAPADHAAVEREPFVMPASEEELSAMFDNMTPLTSYKKDGESNPLYTQRFGADPGFLVWNDRLYVYTTNDVVEYDRNGNVKENSYGQVNQINCISSSDLVNWTDHGAIPAAGYKGIASWANNSWAPCAAHKVIDGQDRFFLYFCNGGNGICVLTADDPAGPWTDPLGHGFITRETPNCANVPWLFDPAVFVDEDGTGYLYFGGGVPEGMQAAPGTVRCVRLGDDMLSIVGEPQVIDAPYVFEDGGMNRIGDTYYYSYCSNWQTDGNGIGLTSGAIQYMTAPTPMGPFTYGGELFVNQGRFFGLYGNNHHSIVTFQGVHYLIYHNRPVEKAMGITGNYRSPQMDVLPMSEDGRLGPVTGTMKGIAQLHTLDPYQPVSARTIYREAGIEVTGCGPDALLVAHQGDFIQVKGVEFASGAAKFTLRAASGTGGAVRVLTGGVKGDVLCEFTIPAGTDMQAFTVDCQDVTGVADVYLLFAGDVTADWWQVTGK